MTYRRHSLEIGPLVFGLVFLGIVAAWSLFELDVVNGQDAAWILPIVLIGAGGLGVVLAATKPRRTEPVEYAPVTDPATPWQEPMQEPSEPTWMTYDEHAAEHSPSAHDVPGRHPAAAETDTETDTDTETNTESPTQTRAFGTGGPQTKEHNDE